MEQRQLGLDSPYLVIILFFLGYLSIASLSFFISPIKEALLEKVSFPDALTFLIFFIGLSSIVVGVCLGLKLKYNVSYKKQLIYVASMALLYSFVFSMVFFGEKLCVAGFFLSIFLWGPVEAVIYGAEKELFMPREARKQKPIILYSIYPPLLSLFLSLTLYLFSFSFIGKIPLFSGIAETYHPMAAVGRALGILSFSAVLSLLRSTKKRLILLVLVASCFSLYGFRVDVAVVFLTFLIITLAREKINLKKMLKYLLMIAFLVMFILGFGYLKALRSGQKWREEITPLHLFLLRNSISLGVFNEITKSSPLLGGKAGLVWLRNEHPNVVIGEFLGEGKKGITATFFAPFIIDGGLFETVTFPLILGFIVGNCYRLKVKKAALASYGVCLSELISKVEMGFSLFEITIFLVCLRTCIYLSNNMTIKKD